MSLIITSAEDPKVEYEIAKRVADAIGYQCLGPELLSTVAEKYNLPAEKLPTALEKQPPSILRRNARRFFHYLACIEAEVTERLKADNIVCWGLAAQLYVLGVSHVLRVRLLAGRARLVALMAKDRNISTAKAEKELAKVLAGREQWSLSVFNQNESDPSFYDLVINLTQIDPDEAVNAVSQAVAYRKFTPNTYSIHSLADLALAAKVKAVLSASQTDFSVNARDGRVVVTAKAMKRERQKKAAAIKELAGGIEGVQFVEVHLINYVIRQAAERIS